MVAWRIYEGKEVMKRSYCKSEGETIYFKENCFGATNLGARASCPRSQNQKKLISASYGCRSFCLASYININYNKAFQEIARQERLKFKLKGGCMSDKALGQKPETKHNSLLSTESSALDYLKLLEQIGDPEILTDRRESSQEAYARHQKIMSTPIQVEKGDSLLTQQRKAMDELIHRLRMYSRCHFDQLISVEGFKALLHLENSQTINIVQLKRFLDQLSVEDIDKIIDRLSQNEEYFLGLFGDAAFFSYFAKSPAIDTSNNLRKAMDKAFKHFLDNQRYFTHLFPTKEVFSLFIKNLSGDSYFCRHFRNLALEQATKTTENFKHIFKNVSDVIHFLEITTLSRVSAYSLIISIIHNKEFFDYLFSAEGSLEQFIKNPQNSILANIFRSCVIHHAASLNHQSATKKLQNLEKQRYKMYGDEDFISWRDTERTAGRIIDGAILFNPGQSDALPKPHSAESVTQETKESKQTAATQQLPLKLLSSIPKPQHHSDDSPSIERKDEHTTSHSDDSHYEALLKKIGPNLNHLIGHGEGASKGESAQVAYERHTKIINSFTPIESIEELMAILRSASPYYLSKIISAKNLIALFASDQNCSDFFRDNPKDVNIFMGYLFEEPTYFQYMFFGGKNLGALISGAHLAPQNIASNHKGMPHASYEYADKALKYILKDNMFRSIFREAKDITNVIYQIFYRMNLLVECRQDYLGKIFNYFAQNPEDFKHFYTNPFAAIQLLREAPENINIIRNEHIQSDPAYFRSLFKTNEELIAFLKKDPAHPITESAESKAFENSVIESVLGDIWTFNALVKTEKALKDLLKVLPKKYHPETQHLFSSPLKDKNSDGGSSLFKSVSAMFGGGQDSKAETKQPAIQDTGAQPSAPSQPPSQEMLATPLNADPFG